MLENTNKALPNWKIIHKANHAPKFKPSDIKYTKVDDVEYVEVAKNNDLACVMGNKPFISIPITLGSNGYFAGIIKDFDVIGFVAVSEDDIKNYKGTDTLTPSMRNDVISLLQGIFFHAYYAQ